MDKLKPLRDLGMPIDEFPEKLKSTLEELSDEEIGVLAKIQKKNIDGGIGSVKPDPALGGGGSGSCLY